MGKWLADLDARLGRTLSKCENAYSQGDYRTACMLLWQANFHLPPKASITDLPNPSTCIRYRGLRNKLIMDEQYRDWYDRNSIDIYKAIAQFNQDEILAYAEANGGGNG